jgi:hypothetical protein
LDVLEDLVAHRALLELLFRETDRLDRGTAVAATGVGDEPDRPRACFHLCQEHQIVRQDRLHGVGDFLEYVADVE